MKLLIIITLFLTATFSAFSRDELSNTNPADYPMHYIGAAASSLSAPGLSYKIFVTPEIGFKVTGFIYYDEDESIAEGDDIVYYDNKSNSKQLIYMIGGEFNYSIINRENTRFYALAGLGYFYNNEESNNDYRYSYDYKNEDIRFTTGGGFGFEIALWEHIVFDGQVTLQYVNDQEETYTNSERTLSDHGKGITIGGGVGIYFKF